PPFASYGVERENASSSPMVVVSRCAPTLISWLSFGASQHSPESPAAPRPRAPHGFQVLPREGYSCKHRRVFPRLHADVQNAAGLKLLQELDNQSFLVAVSSKLVGATQVKSKSTTKRHRQRELKTVLGKREVMVPHMAQ